MDSTTCSKHISGNRVVVMALRCVLWYFLAGMFGLLGYIIFGVFFVLSCIAKFMAFKHLGPKWIERFVLSNRSS